VFSFTSTALPLIAFRKSAGDFPSDALIARGPSRAASRTEASRTPTRKAFTHSFARHTTAIPTRARR